MSAKQSAENQEATVWRVLLVEDHALSREVAERILARMGLGVTAVADGPSALEALGRAGSDLVLMDVEMPGMDGFETTRRMRAAGWVTLPVIAMTAHARTSDRERCLAAGMNDYLTKPLTAEALRAMLTKWRARGAADPARDVQPALETPPDTTPPPAPDAPAVVWDEAGLRARLLDDPALFAVIVVGFLADLPGQLSELEARLAAPDAAGAARRAHTIKGAAANVGGENLRALAFEVERAANAGQLEAARQGLVPLRAAFDALAARMRVTI